MKHYSMWNVIIAKRLIRSPFFWICMALFLILPVLVRNEIEKHGVGVHVLILNEGEGAEAEELRELLTAESNSVISFEEWNGSETEMRDRISQGEAQAGYIIPADVTERIRTYHVNGAPILTAVRSDREVSVRVIDEVVYGKLFDIYAESIAQDFAASTDGTKDEQRMQYIHDRYEGYQSMEIPFLFQHADGSEFTEFMYEDDRSIAVLPLKGLIGLLVVLMSLSGGFSWYTDRKRGVFMRLSGYGRNLVLLSYILIPTLAAALTGLLTNMLLLRDAFANEVVSMLVLVALQVPVVFLILKAVRSEALYMALIPVIIVWCLIAGSVFAELDDISVISWLQKITPMHYYMLI